MTKDDYQTTVSTLEKLGLFAEAKAVRYARMQDENDEWYEVSQFIVDNTTSAWERDELMQLTVSVIELINTEKRQRVSTLDEIDGKLTELWALIDEWKSTYDDANGEYAYGPSAVEADRTLPARREAINLWVEENIK